MLMINGIKQKFFITSNLYPTSNINIPVGLKHFLQIENINQIIDMS